MIRQVWQAFCHRQHGRRLQVFSEADLQASAVIIAPHQDDEVLGCGGTIIRKRQAGAEVNIIFLTDGSDSHGHLMPADKLAEIRHKEALAAAQHMDVPADHVHFFDWPDGNLSQCIPQATLPLTALLQRLAPAQLFFPGAWESPPDHLAARTIALQASQALALRCYEYPIWFWYHWPMVGWPRRFHHVRYGLTNTWTARFGWRQTALTTAVAIENVWPLKRAALAAHQTQVNQYGNDPRWFTLAQVAQGEFLDAFFQSNEYFRRVR